MEPLENVDQYLQSTESLDRSSPELWPHRTEALCQNLLSRGAMGGISHLQQTAAPELSPVKISDKEFTVKDIKLFHEYAALSSSQIVDVVKQLQNVAYLLGLEEAKEMRRGKYLNILRRT